MALLNRFSKLNDRGETGIFTFIVTKSVTRDLHRDATTKDFCFGYHRWAISFQRPTDKMLGVHLLLRNASPSTACVVDFTLALLNREHFSQNQVYSKRQAKFTITNPMQGVSRWIELSELAERRFSNETGEFLFELSLSNMTTIFECDIQLSSVVLNQYKQMLKFGQCSTAGSNSHQSGNHNKTSSQANNKNSNNNNNNNSTTAGQNQLINLETNNFTFGSFEWSLTIVPLVVSSSSSTTAAGLAYQNSSSASSSQDSFSQTNNNGSNPFDHHHHHHHHHQQQQQQTSSRKHQKSSTTVQSRASTGAGGGPLLNLEPVCRVYLNRLNGFDSLCRVKYRVILGHHQPGGAQSAEFVDSKQLDQISDCRGRIRGHQFRQTNVLKLISLRHQQATTGSQQQTNPSSCATSAGNSGGGGGGSGKLKGQQAAGGPNSSLDLRVHIEMFCANTISEARVPLTRNPNEPQVSNCSDRNKQAWCVESDSDSGELLKLKLFFMDLQSVPRNHIRYISWIAHLVRRDPKTGQTRDSLAVRNSPHSNYYLQDGIDLGAMMETDVQVDELNKSPKSYLDNNMLTVHIEWIDSLLLFSHLYNNYDALATIQRHQISRELSALQQEFDYLEGKYLQAQRTLNRLSNGTTATGASCTTTTNSTNNNDNAQPVGHNGNRGQQQRHQQQIAPTQRQQDATVATVATAATTTTTTTGDNKHQTRRGQNGQPLVTLNELRGPVVRRDLGGGGEQPDQQQQENGPNVGTVVAVVANNHDLCLSSNESDGALLPFGQDESRDARLVNSGNHTTTTTTEALHRAAAGAFRELEEEICLIGAANANNDEELRMGARSMAFPDDRQAINDQTGLNTTGDQAQQQSRQLPLAYAFETTMTIATSATGPGKYCDEERNLLPASMLQKQRQQHNNLDHHQATVVAGHRATQIDLNNGRCASSLSLGETHHHHHHYQHNNNNNNSHHHHHQAAASQQLQNNYATHHFSGRLSGGDLSTLMAAGRMYGPQANLAQGLTDSLGAAIVGQPVAAVSNLQQQTVIGVRRSSSIRRRLPQPNVSSQSPNHQSRRPSSAVLPSSDSGWIHQTLNIQQQQNHQGSPSSEQSYDLANHTHHHQQQSRQQQLNRNELALARRRQSPAGCQFEQPTGVRVLGDDGDDGMSPQEDDVIVVDGSNAVTSAASSTLNLVADVGGGRSQALFNRFHQPRHSADSAPSRLPGTCSPSYLAGGLNVSIREKQTATPPTPPTTVSFPIHNQQRLSICDGRPLDRAMGQFYNLIGGINNNNNNNNAGEQHNRFINETQQTQLQLSDSNDNTHDHQLGLTRNMFATDQNVALEPRIQAQQHREQPFRPGSRPFLDQQSLRKQSSDSITANMLPTLDGEHQDIDELVVLPIDNLSMVERQHQQQLFHREITPNGARHSADFQSILANERQMKLSQLNSSVELGLNKNDTGDDSSPQPISAGENQPMSMIAGNVDVNSLGDKSNLKLRHRLLEQQQYDSDQLGPNPLTAQVNDSNWLATTTNHHNALRRP